MIIDTHIHCFADKIAGIAGNKLIETAGIPAYTDFTERDTRQKLDEWGIDLGIVLPIATKPSQQQIVNDWAASLQHGNLLSFGSVHPDAEDALQELERIKSLGLKGIKLHPDYQNFFVDEKRIYPIYQKISYLRLPVVFHTGFDPLSPEVMHSTPTMIAKISREFPELIIIAAHMGGMRMGEECLKVLAGADNVYLDLALIEKARTQTEVINIINKHGSDKILFATDCPWCLPSVILERLEDVDISFEQKEDILWRNAAKLFNIRR